MFYRPVYILIIIGVFTRYVASNYVPVIGWGSSNIAYSSSLSGHELSNDAFLRDYLSGSFNGDNKNVVVFLQDKLGLHDIILNSNVYDEKSDGGKFINLKRNLNENSLFTLPNVENPGQAINDFKEVFDGSVHRLGYPYYVDDVVTDDSHNLIIVPLPKMQYNNIAKIDAIIGEVTKRMFALNKPFTAIYTGRQPSKLPSVSMHSNRNLLAVSNNTDEFVVVSDCALFYAKSIQFGYLTKSKYTYTDVSKSFTVKTDCNDTTGRRGGFVMSFTDGEDLKSFSLKLEMSLEGDGFWYLQTSANWTYDGDSGEDDYVSKSTVWAPKDFSYHCTNPIFPAFVEQGKPTSVLKFIGLQVELGAFDLTEPEFSYANDCDGYFSIGSLLSLFVGIILILIFAFGVTMLSNINTMDRFDDPKGKSITVAVSE